jgi:alkanesulfonate monooxygenase SsuD/methylene tetrahydromethanopterin reductase-like flavin-dependent oxidoreductase (luciferase family)
VRKLLGPDGEIVVYAWMRVDEDGDRAREVVRPLVRARRDEGMYPNLIRLGGVPEEGEIDDGSVDRTAVAGTPQGCAHAIARLAGAGASAVAVLPVGDGLAEQVERFATDVAPLVRERSWARRSGWGWSASGRSRCACSSTSRCPTSPTRSR